MDDRSTYQKIADYLKDEILSGNFLPGARLPGVRELSEQWGCTVGTVQKSFDQLVKAGLVESTPGKGTFVTSGAQNVIPKYEGFRRISLVLKTEQFILESITAGYSLEEISEGLHLATEHWRVLGELPEAKDSSTIRFYGSSDTVINMLAEMLDSYIPDIHLQVAVTGSMEGIMAVGKGKADIAGCHLWDPETCSYNLPYIQKLIPGRDVKVVTLARRNIGLITAPGNPLELHTLTDLAKPNIRFVNRQSGSGTRVWFDQQLKLAGLQPDQINGYHEEKMTHTEIARMIVEGSVDAGIGLEAAARAFSLDFTLLTQEQFDLVALKEAADQPPVSKFFDWLTTPAAREFISQFYGYDTSLTGVTRLE